MTKLQPGRTQPDDGERYPGEYDTRSEANPPVSPPGATVFWAHHGGTPSRVYGIRTEPDPPFILPADAIPVSVQHGCGGWWIAGHIVGRHPRIHQDIFRATLPPLKDGDPERYGPPFTLKPAGLKASPRKGKR